MNSVLKIEQFLFHEAQLLDQRQFERWLELFSSTGYYWMPCKMNADRQQHDSAIIDDDVNALAMRIKRLRLPSAHSEAPAPNACRVLSNITIVSATPLVVRAKLVMHEFQRRAFARDDYRVFCATLSYQLTPAENAYLIDWKRVDLVDAGGSRTCMATPV